jgi:hypothetical protein
MARSQRRRDSAKERHWRRIVQQWRRSRLSVREFCDWQELSEASFYGWRRELAKRDREALGSPAAVKSESRVAEPNGLAAARTPAFLPVQVVPETQTVVTGRAPRTDCIEVHLLSGVRLHVPAGCDRWALVEVLAALETRPC